MEQNASVIVMKLDGTVPNGGTLMVIVDSAEKTVSLIEIRPDQILDEWKLKVVDVQPYTRPGT